MGGDDAEKVALIIETQAQLAGLRQTSAGLSDLAAQTATSSAQVKISAAQDAAAWAKADGSVHEYNLEIARLVAAQRLAAVASSQTAAATAQATTATAAASDVVGNRLSPSLRSSSLAASRLTLAFDGMGGGVLGVARSVGMLSYGVADLSGPGLAALASGVAAGAIVLATLGDLLYKDAQRATALSDAFKDHLGNLKFDATTAAINDVHKAMGGLETQIPTLTQKLTSLLQYGPAAFTNANNSFLTNLRHELTLTTDAEDLFGQKLKENEALGARNAEQTKAMADAVSDLNAAYGNSILASSAKARELQDQISGNTYAAQRVALVEAEREQVAEINKTYADFAKNQKALTADQVVQQQVEIANAQTQLTLGLKLVDVQKARADAQKAQALADATAMVRARGAGATSDTDGPVGAYNKRLIEIDKEYNDATVKQHVDATVAKATRDAEYLRAYRDMTNGLLEADRKVQEANARSGEEIASANSDQDSPESRRDIAKLKAAQDYDKALATIGIDRDAADDARRARNERADRDFYAAITDAARQSDAIISSARDDIDATADEAQQRLDIWNNYYDNLNKKGVDQVALQQRTAAQLARLDRDRFNDSLNHLSKETDAYKNYSGVIGAIAKGLDAAIRKYKIGAQVMSDIQDAKSSFADGLWELGQGNIGGAALDFAASAAYAASAAFGAGEALGAGGGGGAGGSGGGAAGGGSSTFTPGDTNKSGGQVFNLYTVNPFSREVTAAMAYYLDQQGVLKVPIQIPPTFGLTSRAA